VNTQPPMGRKLRQEERRLITALAPSVTTDLGGVLVVEMRDGHMGSIRFLNPSDRRRSLSIAKAEFVDDDGVSVSIELNIDEKNELFELDFWKVDFSPLRRYPSPEDVKLLK
jgi:hypothetical protein